MEQLFTNSAGFKIANYNINKDGYENSDDILKLADLDSSIYIFTPTISRENFFKEPQNSYQFGSNLGDFSTEVFYTTSNSYRSITIEKTESGQEKYQIEQNTVLKVKINKEELENQNIRIRKLEEELDHMQQKIKKPILNFEKRVMILGYFLSISFLILSLPFFIGPPALVGVIGGFGFLVYVKLRRWERDFIER